MKQVGPYIFLNRVGKGHYAQVYMAKHQETGKAVAVKIMKRTGISVNQLNNIKNEITVLERVNHANVISLIDRMKSDNHYYLVLEYCNGGNLSSYLELVKRAP